jgi:Ca2+-binding EF-hand superfamily protein
MLQEMHQAEIADGVVERDILQKVMVEPSVFIGLRQRIEEEFERLAEGTEQEGPRGPLWTSEAVITGYGSIGPGEGKPSMDTLCQRLGMTMARMEWLYNLFESYLNGDGEEGSKYSYPDNPGSITKDHMREILREMNPDLTDPEFEARFLRIDEDGSGTVEFDEFAMWVHDDEVDVVGITLGENRGVEQLAELFGEPEEVINYLLTCWKDQFPEGESDDYPTTPGKLSKQDIRYLLTLLTPTVTDEEFEERFCVVDVEQKERLEFDEFLDVVDFEFLSDEIRNKFGFSSGPVSPSMPGSPAPFGD